MIVIDLTPQELIVAAHLAGLIDGVKQVQVAAGDLKNRRVAGMPDFGMHYIGMLGEVAVSRVLDVPLRKDVTKYGDGYIDLHFRGQSLQIKTRAHANLGDRRRFFFLNSMNEFRADWLIGCSMQSPSAVGIHGFISRAKFDKRKFAHDFGYGERVCVAEDDLADISMINEAIEPTEATA